MWDWFNCTREDKKVNEHEYQYSKFKSITDS